MVLKCFVILASIIFLTACGSHAIKTLPSVKQRVIPVVIEKNTAGIKKNAEKPEVLDYPSTIRSPEPPLPITRDLDLDLPSNNIIDTLLVKAQKAFSLQQWLRTQHILEQAIRLDPNESRVFMLYGDVYSEIGVTKQAQNMYQRALYLATEGSEIKATARSKLDVISNQLSED